MTNYNEEYFFIADNEDERYPMLDLNDDYCDEYAMPLLRAEPIVYDKPILLEFAYPVPRNPKMGDYHSLEKPSPVFSEKLKKVIEDMQVKDIQFVPVLIEGKKKEMIEGYHAIKVCNLIYCADLETSEYDTFDDGRVCTFEKLVLDNVKLDKIPLEDRLIFAVGEKRTYVVYHISVVEKMLATAPEGMTVYRLAGWDSSVPFYEAYGEYLKGLL